MVVRQAHGLVDVGRRTDTGRTTRSGNQLDVRRQDMPQATP
jgi:hypothetical protein